MTEAKDPNTDNIFAIHKLFSTEDELAELKNKYENGEIGYKESKELLVEKIIKFITAI